MIIELPTDNQKNTGEPIFTKMELMQFCSMISVEIPIAFIFRLLDFSENQFLGLLNGNEHEYIPEYKRNNRLSTNFEDDFLKCRANGKYFFTREKLFQNLNYGDWYSNGSIVVDGEIRIILPKECIAVNYKDFMDWLSKNNNYEHLREYHMQMEAPRRLSPRGARVTLLMQRKIEELTKENVRLRDRIVELEAELENAEPKTTVDAKRWKACTEAVLRLYSEIWTSEDQEKVYIKDVFYKKLHKMTHADYLTTVDRLAWDCLPDKYKSGPGRPKKNEIE